MTERTVFHVVPDANSWKVRQASSGEYEVLVDDKDNAVAHAKELAKQQEPSQVVVHNRDGKISDEFTYGDDPRNIPG